jgi:hypothetical protein
MKCAKSPLSSISKLYSNMCSKMRAVFNITELSMTELQYAQYGYMGPGGGYINRQIKISKVVNVYVHSVTSKYADWAGI